MFKNHHDFLGEMNGSEPAEGESGRPRELPRRMMQTVPGRPRIRREPHVLLVSGDEALADILISILDESGFAVEHATSIADGCALAESGHFYVVLTEPSLSDGSWRCLADLATRNHAKFVLVLIAKRGDLPPRFYAKQDGVFDVIDASNDLSRAGDVVAQALWVEYLNGSGPVPDLLRLSGRGGSH